MLKWPARADVVDALRRWAVREARSHPELQRVGYFGSLADGVRYGVGSDADVIAIVTRSAREHWRERPLDFDPPDEVPINVDLFVYTEDELAALLDRRDAFARDLRKVVWL